MNATFLMSQAAMKVEQAAVKVQPKLWSKLVRHRNTGFHGILKTLRPCSSALTSLMCHSTGPFGLLYSVEPCVSMSSYYKS